MIQLSKIAILTALLLVAALPATAASPAAAGSALTPRTLGSVSPLRVLPAAANAGCTDGIVYDDGGLEDGLSFNDNSGFPLANLDLVMRFDVGEVGVPVEQVCVCWTRAQAGTGSFDFDLVFYAPNGPGGRPGTLIDLVPARISTTIPAFPQGAFFDIRNLLPDNIETTAPNVYVGVRWSPELDPDIFLCTDEDGPGTQPAFASGDEGAAWSNLRTDLGLSTLNALMIRANFQTEPSDPRLPEDSPGEGFDTGDTSPCIPGGLTTLCLSNDRFQVDVDFRTPQGTTGEGRAKVLTADTGYFWFFDEDNVEMVVKVLDTCNVAQFNRFWVFAGGLTNVEVEMVVRDTETGLARRYMNPLRTPFQPLQDTQAFATCP